MFAVFHEEDGCHCCTDTFLGLYEFEYDAYSAAKRFAQRELEQYTEKHRPEYTIVKRDSSVTLQSESFSKYYSGGTVSEYYWKEIFFGDYDA